MCTWLLIEGASWAPSLRARATLVPWLRDAWPSLEHLLLRTSARRRRPTSAPIRIRTSGSVAPSTATPSAPASRLSPEYYDPGVSGADPIEGRKGFAELLDRVENNGVATVIVEDASRFARELVVQELGRSACRSLERRERSPWTAPPRVNLAVSASACSGRHRTQRSAWHCRPRL